jgi:hypothetical protein
MFAMSLVFRKVGGSVLTGLLAIVFGSPAGMVSAQSYSTDRDVSATAPGNSLRPTSSPVRTAKFAYRNTSGTTTEIVEGGTYFDDGKGNLVPSGTPAARAIAGPAAGGPARTVSPSSPSAAHPARATAVPNRTAVGTAPRPMAEPRSRPVSRRTAEPAEETVLSAPSETMLGPLEEACCDDGSCEACCLEPCCAFPFLPLDNLELSTGVLGFTGPANRGSTGSFGFYECLNWGAPLPLFDTCLGMQFGARATQSNLSGAEFTGASRDQVFITAGLFRRVDLGLQGGVVVDYLNDSWYRNASLSILRGELSWVFDGQDDIGFWFTTAHSDSTDDSVILSRVVRNNVVTIETTHTSETWRATDLYAFFYRRQLGECRDGEARIFGGFSSQGDGLIGTDCRLPLTDTWSLEGTSTYLIPKQGQGIGLEAGHAQESWNISLGLVWVPGRAFHGHGDSRYYRPLFRVADNGVFMLDRQ